MIEYAGLFVREKSDGSFVVTDQLGANVMPGATYFATEEAALQAIDVFKVVDGDGPKFWHLLRAVQRQLPYSGFQPPYHDHRLCRDDKLVYTSEEDRSDGVRG